MQSEGDWMSLRVLRSHGWSLTALAREFHLNWRTVKREVEAEEARRYQERAKPTALTQAQLAHVERRLQPVATSLDSGLLIGAHHQVGRSHRRPCHIPC